MSDNLVSFFRQRSDVFPLKGDFDLIRFLAEAVDDPAATLPMPAKLFLVDEVEPHGYGFPLARNPALDEAAAKFEKWTEDEIASRGGSGPKRRSDESLQAYRATVVKLARNALQSSILADYHSVFWLVHTQQVAAAFTMFPRRVMTANPAMNREEADVLKYRVAAKWAQMIRETLPEIAPKDHDRALRFPRLVIDNPLLFTEEFIGSDLRELRSYFAGHLRRDYNSCRKWIDNLRSAAARLLERDALFRRAIAQLGYPESAPTLMMLLDRRVQQLVSAHPSYTPEPDASLFESLSKRLLEFYVIYYLRRGVVWMKTTAEGENVSDEQGKTPIVYSRGLRPMNFGRKGVVEPIVYRYGLVYDITSFTQTLGEIARGGKEGEQTSYRQMLEFQRELAEIARRHGLQFEKFLGDGAFYTARRATRTIQAAIDVQSCYAAMRARGFAFDKGMRIALNYGYYRLLPMQVSTDGTEIKEFYGPGIVELSRLTTGKATKEIEDIQQLLVSHGYDQSEVYRFFAPLARGTERSDAAAHSREFYAFVNQHGHLINEGIVASIPFLRRLSDELAEDQQKVYRLTTLWDTYVGIPVATEAGAYIGIRILGSVSLKGIGNVEVGEIVRVTPREADVSVMDENKALLTILQQERNRSTARGISTGEDDVEIGLSDLVVCQSSSELLVGEWDPLAQEIRHPVQLDRDAAERFGLEIPLTAETIETHSASLQRLYRSLSRMETLPSFSITTIRENTNFNGFIVGSTIEPL